MIPVSAIASSPRSIPLHSPGSPGLVVAAITAALIVILFCAAIDAHYRRRRHQDLRWYADRIHSLQSRQRNETSSADTTPLPVRPCEQPRNRSG